MSEIAIAIDLIFEQEAITRKEELQFFIERLHERYNEVQGAMMRYLFSIPILWLLAFAIHHGFVTEGELASFKLAQLRSLLLIFPALFGFIAYLLSGVWNTGIVLSDALSGCYKHFLPTVHRLELHYLTAAPDFANIERIFWHPAGRYARIGNAFVAYTAITLFLLGPLAGILHVGYMHISRSGLSLPLILSGAIGLVFWLRGLVLMGQDYMIPKSGTVLSDTGKDVISA